MKKQNPISGETDVLMLWTVTVHPQKEDVIDCIEECSSLADLQTLMFEIPNPFHTCEKYELDFSPHTTVTNESRTAKFCSPVSQSE